MPLPTKILLEVVTPEGLLLREEVDEVVAPGEEGYFGVRPGHTPFLATLGIGSIMYRKGEVKHLLTSFWGFCEVLPDRVNILAEVGERAQDIDPARAEQAKEQAAAEDEDDPRRGRLPGGPGRVHESGGAPQRGPPAPRLRRVFLPGLLGHPPSARRPTVPVALRRRPRPCRRDVR